MTYDYKCTHCGAILQDVYRSIKEPPLTLCQMCGNNTLETIIFGGIHCSVVHDPVTLKQQADRNTKKMGHYELQDREHKDQLRSREVKFELNRLGGLDAAAKERYIKNG